MENLSEVLKILDGALKANSSMAMSYAGLLADKLEAAGERVQARRVRERLTRAPTALASAQDASRGFSNQSAPVDSESKLHTVDISHPNVDADALLLPNGIKRRIHDFLDAVNHFDALAQAGAAQPCRLLAYGPPGTGKTHLARSLAAQLRLPLLTVRCDTLVSSLLGQTSKNLRRVFEYAQQTRCVLFLDEFDALASARGNERDVGELQRVVIALLQNIDAMPEETILVASTNHHSLLDPAVWRRFPFQVAMPLPERGLREQLWRTKLGTYAPKGLSWIDLAGFSEGLSGAAIEQVCLDAKRTAVLARSATVEEGEIYRRLGLVVAMHSGAVLTTVRDEVTWLRRWNDKQFSLRELSRLYGVTTRAISGMISGAAIDGEGEQFNERPRGAGST